MNTPPIATARRTPRRLVRASTPVAVNAGLVSSSRSFTTRALLLALAALAMVPGSGSAQSVLERSLKDELLFMDDEEPDMRRAFRRARDTLDDFLQKAGSPAPGTVHYAVKVGVREGARTEYFWIGPFVQERDGFSGRLDNTPQMVKSVREGQTYRFPKSHIVDWMYFDRTERRMHGNYTLCALLTKEPPAEAAKARTRFGLSCE